MVLRPVAFLSSAFLALALMAGAQEPIRPPLTPRIINPSKTVALFTGLEKSLLQAVQNKDRAALNSFLGDDFLISMPNADPVYGEDWIETVSGSDHLLKTFIVQRLSVVDLGTAALVSYNRVQQATFKGKSDSGEFFVVDLWMKDGNSWKLANRYVTKVS